jgi:stage III sporulation protein SpoIIIAA
VHSPAPETADQQIEITDNLAELLAVLPVRLRDELTQTEGLDTLIEVVCDLGRLPEARFPHTVKVLDRRPVTREDLDYVASRVGAFANDNRAGIERTLHRISALRNRVGQIIGLTCRVGRAVYGTVAVVRDVVESGKSMLLVGRPGVGKTTLLREAARVLADELNKRVMIVDTSNEIAGDGDVPHPGIGGARRMQVRAPEMQHDVMIEAVENHMPEVIVIDEIGTEAEALAARTIAERGVQLIATAHGNTLENLVANPTLADLVGGIQAVTLGDEEARRRRTQKTVLERKAPPTFDVVIEIREKDRFAVHHDVAAVVDALLRHRSVEPELRTRRSDGGYEIDRPPAPTARPVRETRATARVFPYGLSRERLERAISNLGVPAIAVDELQNADCVVTLRDLAARGPRRLRDQVPEGVPVYVAPTNSVSRIEEALREAFDMNRLRPEQEQALREAEEAVVEVIAHRQPVELSPQAPSVRRLQHQLASAYGLESQSVGREPFRHVVIRSPRR